MGVKTAGKVIEVRRIGKRDLEVVLQTAIAEERVARQKLLRVFEDWSEKHNAIRAAIEGGAIVEEGLYRADVAPEKCVSPILGLPFTLTRLTIS
jgi:hypothetical protein